jgi:hypothetical protein
MAPGAARRRAAARRIPRTEFKLHLLSFDLVATAVVISNPCASKRRIR